MTSMSLRILLMAGAALAVSGCNKAGTANSNTAAAETKTESATTTTTAASSDPVASAESAAPASHAPDTPGPDPMCFDANAGKWAAAWMHHKPPPDGTPGVMYMLEGGTDASNTDPYAKSPTADNDWVKTGPHIMLVGSKAMLAGYPSGAKPNTSAPYVMWAGTPYAHLMVPVNKS
jgi:hypothetical protein